jgi:ubiquinol-cytochrome c reductase cytochrome c1 subunit
MVRRFPMPLLAVLLVTAPALASAAGPAIPLEPAAIDLRDQASLQRGAQLYMNYCLGCHSLQFVRYNTLAEGLGLTEQQVAENLQFTGERIHDQIRIALPRDDAANWFGQAPPDLTLVARSRGVDWIYTFLRSFYADPASRLTGANNKVLEGTSMPHVLWELQGIQQAVYREETGAGGSTRKVFTGFELIEPGSMSPQQFDGAVRDITAFLSWAAEPMQLQRQRLGWWVLLFLSVLFILTWLLYKEYWKDVK